MYIDVQLLYIRSPVNEAVGNQATLDIMMYSDVQLLNIRSPVNEAVGKQVSNPRHHDVQWCTTAVHKISGEWSRGQARKQP